jgi:hypothetical protein
VGGGPGEDVDDPSGGADPLPPGAPCPDRVVTQDGTPAHGCLIWVRVAVTSSILPLSVDKALRENGGEPEKPDIYEGTGSISNRNALSGTAILNRALIIRPDTWVSLKVTSLKKVSLSQN